MSEKTPDKVRPKTFGDGVAPPAADVNLPASEVLSRWAMWISSLDAEVKLNHWRQWLMAKNFDITQIFADLGLFSVEIYEEANVGSNMYRVAIPTMDHDDDGQPTITYDGAGVETIAYWRNSLYCSDLPGMAEFVLSEIYKAPYDPS